MQAQLLKQDNPGDCVRCLRDFSSGLHCRHRLLDCAFKELGSMPMQTIQKLRVANQVGDRTPRVDNDQGI